MVSHTYGNMFEKKISLIPFLYKWLSKKWPIIGLNVSGENRSVDIGFHILDCFVKANLFMVFGLTLLEH